MKLCKDCRHFTDAHYSKVYITPICTVHGGDEATFMRGYICGVDEARLYEPKPVTEPAREVTKET